MHLNPIIWLHSHLDNNLRNGLIGVAVYVVAIFVGLSLALHFNPNEAPQIFATFLGIATAAQAIFVLVLVPAGIRKFVQRDYTTGVVESHRLTPLANRSLILGFIVGPALQGLSFYVASALLGLFFTFKTASSPGLGGRIGVETAIGMWFFLQICLLTFAFFVANLVVLGSIALQGKTNWIGGVFVALLFGGWMAVFAVPGLSLLLGIMSGGAVVSMIQKGAITGDERAIVLSVLFQFVLALLLFAGACRRIRRPDRPIFSIRLGLGLLLVWGTVLVIGMTLVTSFRSLFSDWLGYGRLQIIASIGTFVLVAYAPLSSAAWRSIHPKTGESRTPIVTCAATAIAIGLLAFACVWLMALAILRPDQLDNDARVAFQHAPTLGLFALVFVMNAWTDYHFLTWIMAREKKLVVYVVGMVVVLKIIPPALDALLGSVVNELTNYEWPVGYLTAASPFGTLIGIGQDRIPLWIGVGVQLVIAAFMFYAAHRARRRYQEYVIVQSATEADVKSALGAAPVAGR